MDRHGFGMTQHVNNLLLQCTHGQAKNGTVSHAFLTAALRACHAKRPCIFEQDVEYWANRISCGTPHVYADVA